MSRTSCGVNAMKSGSISPGLSSMRNQSAWAVSIPTAAAPWTSSTSRSPTWSASFASTPRAARALSKIAAPGLRAPSSLESATASIRSRELELFELAPEETRWVGPRVRDDAHPETLRVQGIEQLVRARCQRACRTPDRVLGVEVGRELRVGDRPEQLAKLVAVVEVLGCIRREHRRQGLRSKASGEVVGLAGPAERRKRSSMTRRQQVVVPRELGKRVAPVEENGVQHAARLTPWRERFRLQRSRSRQSSSPRTSSSTPAGPSSSCWRPRRLPRSRG